MANHKVFTLQCHEGHFFEGWFPNQQAFDRQVDFQQIGCPSCLSRKVWIAHAGEVAEFKTIEQVVEEDHGSADAAVAEARAAIQRLQQRIIEATRLRDLVASPSPNTAPVGQEQPIH